MLKKMGISVFALTASLVPFICAQADDAETANKSNNPLNIAQGMSLQDYYTPNFYDSNIHTNDVLVRGTLPIAPNDFIGVPPLIRVTAPISTRPDPSSGYSTGKADRHCSSPVQPDDPVCQLRLGAYDLDAQQQHTEQRSTLFSITAVR